MGKTFQLLLFGLLSLGLFQSAYGQQEKTETAALTEKLPQKTALEIIVPNAVKDRWKSVEISILDHETSIEKTYTINIGESFQVPDSILRLKVDTFLPSFIMNGTQMTSESNDTRNPAAYVVVTENRKNLFTGWLFSLYPDAHTFQDARYNFNLTGYIPTN